MTALPAWAVREPDEEAADWALRLLVATSVRAVANAEPGRCGCLRVRRLTVHVCDLYAGQPLRCSFRTSGTFPVPPRDCGTRHDGTCIHERN